MFTIRSEESIIPAVSITSIDVLVMINVVSDPVPLVLLPVETVVAVGVPLTVLVDVPVGVPGDDVTVDVPVVTIVVAVDGV